MAADTRICKVCGVEYPYCRTFRPAGIFRWQDVACCPEHGSIYFAEVAASRGESFDGLDDKKTVKFYANKVDEDEKDVVPFYYEDDEEEEDDEEWFEEDEEDE